MNVITNFINILETSSLLKNSIPKVRRLCLIQTLWFCKNNEMAISIFLENLTSSPYIKNEDKNRLANMVINNNWENLKIHLKCRGNFNNINTIDKYKKMVMCVFIKSKKIQRINNEKKKYIASLILKQTSIESLKNLTINILENSETLNLSERNIIANNIIDNRYDFILLPSRLDCEEISRINEENEEEECPICLGTNKSDIKLSCGHFFCTNCISNWKNNQIQNNLIPTCPICRKNI